MPKLGRSDPNKSQLNYLIPTGVGSATPYGTTDTPRMKTKIVGGHLSMVIEDQKFTPRGEPPAESRRKRSPRGVDFNPDKINTYPMEVYGYKNEVPSPTRFSESQREPLTQREAPAYRSRAAFSPFRLVPSIESNSRESFEPVKKLEDHLFLGTSLPRQSVVYNKHEELELRHRIQQELPEFDPSHLKDVYLKLTGMDRELTDLIDNDMMVETFRGRGYRTQVPLLPTTLTLVAAQYIDKHTGKVNYSMVLSFIAGALKAKNGSQGHRAREQHKAENPRKISHDGGSSPQAGVYYNPVTHDSYGEDIRSRDWGKAKVMKLMDQQLAGNEDMMPMEEIWKRFAGVDQYHTDRLSVGMIKKLTMDCKIPLADNLINDILGHCDRYHDQYNWRQYLEFIETVKPVQTGYPLPASKRPVEYVKNMPKPTNNWPNPEEVSSPRKQPDYSTLPNNYIKPDKPQKVQDYDRSQSKQSSVDMLDTQIDTLEQQYQRQRARLEEQRSRARGDHVPWIEGFKQLSQAMYNADSKYQGHLSLDKTLRLVTEYNKKCNLKIPQYRIDDAIMACSNDSGNVMIDSVLKMLGVRDIN